MLRLWLYGVRQVGLRTTLVLVLKWLRWWLVTGRKYEQNWGLGRVLFDFIGRERAVKFDGKAVLFSQLPPIPSPAFDNMLFPAKSRKTQNNRIVLYPSYANLAVTARCQFNCWHCSAAGRADSQDDLPLGTWREIVGQVLAAGVYYIALTGGEPLLRNDLEDILSSADQRATLAVATNGVGLTMERARRLKEAGLFYMMVSLDHHRPEIHDRRRRFPGAYEAAVQAMRCARAANLYTIAQAAITRQFVAEEAIWPMAELGKELGVQEIRCRGIVRAGRLLRTTEAVQLRDQDSATFLRTADQINSRPGYPKINLFEDFERPERAGCSAGSMLVYVDSRGNLCPCDFVPLSFGNLRDTSFENAWGRMRSSLGAQNPVCLARYAASAIAQHDGPLPLPLEASQSICQHYRSPVLPGVY